ncbi:hypothetical protein GCM10028774_66940 [Spirosoma jeollabukense]
MTEALVYYRLNGKILLADREYIGENRTDFYDSNNNGEIKIFIFFPPLDTGINAMD